MTSVTRQNHPRSPSGEFDAPCFTTSPYGLLTRSGQAQLNLAMLKMVKGERGRDGRAIYYYGAPQSDAAFRQAVQMGTGLHVSFQPIYDLRGKCAAVEALARYSANGQTLPASELIPRCRELGLLPALGRHVRRKALDAFARFSHMEFAPPQLALNVAAEEVLEPGFVGELLQAIALAGVERDAVTIELTEDTPLPQTVNALGAMRELRAAGLGVALDDFGAGTNGLMALRSLQPTQLKLDRSFMDALVPGDVMIKGIISTAHAMGIDVVAEGIESRAQALILADLGCDLLQGFYLGRPRNVPMGLARPSLLEASTHAVHSLRFETA